MLDCLRRDQWFQRVGCHANHFHDDGFNWGLDLVGRAAPAGQARTVINSPRIITSLAFVRLVNIMTQQLFTRPGARAVQDAAGLAAELAVPAACILIGFAGMGWVVWDVVTTLDAKEPVSLKEVSALPPDARQWVLERPAASGPVTKGELAAWQKRQADARTLAAQKGAAQ